MVSTQIYSSYNNKTDDYQQILLESRRRLTAMSYATWQALPQYELVGLTRCHEILGIPYIWGPGSTYYR